MGDAEKAPLSNEEALKLCGQNPVEAKDFILNQTMYRIKDPRKTLPFYSQVLGMKLLTKLDFPSMKFSLYFMGYEDSLPAELGSAARNEWTMGKRATLELTHNWGSENDPALKYHNGNQEPKGFGHIGLEVPDVYKACEHFEKHGVNFIKKPDDGKMKGIAFITDPDGYWIEILNRKVTTDIVEAFKTE